MGKQSTEARMVMQARRNSTAAGDASYIDSEIDESTGVTQDGFTRGIHTHTQTDIHTHTRMQTHIRRHACRHTYANTR